MSNPGSDERDPTKPLTAPIGPYTRLYDLYVEMYGPDVIHPTLPALVLRANLHHLQPGEPQHVELCICDAYGALENFAELVHDKIAGRRASDSATLEAGDEDWFVRCPAIHETTLGDGTLVREQCGYPALDSPAWYMHTNAGEGFHESLRLNWPLTSAEKDAIEERRAKAEANL